MMVNTFSKYLFTKSNINWTSNSSQILSSIRKQIKSNPNFIKDNGIYITNHVADLLQRYQYENILNILKQVDLRHIDKWQLWTQLSKTINSSIKNTQMIREGKLEQLMQILFKLRYEPHPKQDKQYFQLISSTLQHNKQDFNQFSKISAYTLMYEPQFFIKYRKNIQDQLLQYFLNCSKVEQEKIYIYAQGVIANFWTDQFFTNIKNITQRDPKFQIHRQKLQKYITLPDSNYPTTIQKKAIKMQRSSTQKKIGQMLSDLGYVYQQNMFINNTQVDFLFGKDIIVSYNGMHHYRINNKMGKIAYTRYDLWKNKMLEDRKFKIMHIPFYQWQKLQNQKVQKLYLIQKIESFILQSYRINIK